MSGTAAPGGGNPPPESRISTGRSWVVFLGLLWPVALMIYGVFHEDRGGRDFTFLMIGIIFMALVFGLPALLAGLVFPTYSSRLFGVPVLLVGFYLFVSSDARSNLNLPGMIGIVPWLFSLTAITLLMPELPKLSQFYRWLGRRVFQSQ